MRPRQARREGSTGWGGFWHAVATDRRWWRLLFGINLLGSLYGFWWYRHQLVSTPARYWLVVPDSPGSTLLFAAFLLVLLSGAIPSPGPDRRPVHLAGVWGLLGALAFASNMKYGLWTAIVLPQHAIWSGMWTFEHIHLSLSHAGMWVQGLLYARLYRPGVGMALAAWLWLYFQDFVDYWALQTHPTLPAEALEPSVRLIALGLSTVWGGLVVWLAVRRPRSR